MPNGAFGHPELHPAPGAICDDIGLVWGGGRDFHLGHEGVHGGTVCRQRCDNQCDQLEKKNKKKPSLGFQTLLWMQYFNISALSQAATVRVWFIDVPEGYGGLLHLAQPG